MGMSFMMCVTSLLPCCEAAIVYSQQLAPGISHRHELIPCEIRNDSTAPLFVRSHTQTHTAYVSDSQCANSDATT